MSKAVELDKIIGQRKDEILLSHNVFNPASLYLHNLSITSENQPHFIWRIKAIQTQAETKIFTSYLPLKYNCLQLNSKQVHYYFWS